MNDKINKDTVIGALKKVYDLEIGFDIVSLGMIYGVDIDENNNVEVDMTLTTPACPMSGFLTANAKKAVEEIDGIGDVKINLVFDPPWSPKMISEEVKKALGL
ncbi:MAG: hypothetical protein PWQ77_1194 [Kosmotogales bacterium]|nr:hypothetical protein [Kosmotogales bacterium]